MPVFLGRLGGSLLWSTDLPGERKGGGRDDRRSKAAQLPICGIGVGSLVQARAGQGLV